MVMDYTTGSQRSTKRTAALVGRGRSAAFESNHFQVYLSHTGGQKWSNGQRDAQKQKERNEANRTYVRNYDVIIVNNEKS